MVAQTLLNVTLNVHCLSWYVVYIFFFFNRHCNRSGFWPAQLSLSILSGKVFYRVPVASGTSNPQLGGPVIRTFQLPPPGVLHIWNNAIEPQQRKVELWARNCREFCRKWRLPRHFWVLLHVVNLRHGTGVFTSPPKEGALRIFSYVVYMYMYITGVIMIIVVTTDCLCTVVLNWNLLQL